VSSRDKKLKLDVEFLDILVVGKWSLRVGKVVLDLKRAPGS